MSSNDQDRSVVTAKPSRLAPLKKSPTSKASVESFFQVRSGVHISSRAKLHEQRAFAVLKHHQMLLCTPMRRLVIKEALVKRFLQATSHFLISHLTGA